MERQAVAKAQKSAPSSHPLQRQSAGPSSAGHPLLDLQRSIGNQAVQRLIRSYVQTKLQVSAPGDPFEQEADRVADTVMQMTEPEATRIQTQPLATQITPLVQRESEQPLEEEKEEGVASKPVVQRVPLAVREDDDEEKVPPKLDTNPSPQEEEEKIVATKLAKDASLQRQVREDEEKEEETSQMAPLIQRQMEEEEQQGVQTKPLSSQLSQPTGISPIAGCSADGAIQRLCTECEGEKQRREGQPGEMVQRKSAPEHLLDDEVEEHRVQPKGADATRSVTASVAANIHALNDSGSPLPNTTRAFFEPRFGQDFSEVRVHKGAQAAESAKAINAKAYTIGRDVVFGAGAYAPETGEGKKLLAHELTHVVQQASLRQRVQRYEAGEHAQLGETQAELTAGLAPASYVVQKGEKLSTIAKKFGITVAELKEANKDKLKKWPANDGSGRLIEGFNAGETVSIPRKLNDLAKSAIKDKSATFTVNGVVLDYGVGIAMGDLYESPEQMAKASPKELKELAALIKREQAGGKVTTEEWQKATGGRYLKLAEKNVAHFAPQNAGLVKPSGAGATSSNHKSEWEKHHATALEASRAGDKDKALMINAFGDHFLTDAFAAGHLINKLDVMEQFKSQLKLDAKGENFTAGSQKFFDDVAKDAFTGGVQTEFSKYETVEFKGVVFRPNINSASRFSQLLQGIHKERPDLLANAVAKGVHDRLNTFPGGLPVENAKGDPPWKLSGDGTLNADTRNVARKAVAQSQLNVISVYNVVGPLDTPSLFKRVWDYTPRPSAAGITQLVDEVKKGTDVNSADLKKAMVNLIQSNYMLIIDELVKLNKLKKA